MQEISMAERISSCNDIDALRSLLLHVQASGDLKSLKRRDSLGLTMGHYFAIRMSDLVPTS